MRDDDEEAALLRVRTLRRDGYRCRWQQSPNEPICGSLGNRVGQRPTDNLIVALCHTHSQEVPLPC